MKDMSEEKSHTASSLSVGKVVQQLASLVPGRLDRGAFFEVLAKQLRGLFHYDRFCINLYDAERELLSLFTAANGIMVESLTNARKARNTVAALAISSRKPVVINDLASHDFGDSPMPLSSVGLNATIAIPLIFKRQVIATLHASFVRQPDNIVTILNFLLELSPIISAFLYALLAEERAGHMVMSLAGVNRKQDNRPILESCLLDTPQMAAIMRLAGKAAKLDVPVLIFGETGTGKSMLARWLHNQSARHRENFIKVNCPSLAPSLFESEMFGYAKGAFTGASTKRVGRIEMAQAGTLFLDEIAELTPDMQSKLLQVLEENSFERVGEATSVNVDIRVISATNRDLTAAINQGILRRDLYYRLAGIVIRMPPLRERKNDIPLFLAHFIKNFSSQYGMEPIKLSRPAIQTMQNHPWPGNIRQLRNIVSRLMLYYSDDTISDSCIEHLLQMETNSSLYARADASENVMASAPKAGLTLAENERAAILAALKATNWRIAGSSGAAALLDIPRTTLQNKMRKLGISRAEQIQMTNMR